MGLQLCTHNLMSLQEEPEHCTPVVQFCYSRRNQITVHHTQIKQLGLHKESDHCTLMEEPRLKPVLLPRLAGVQLNKHC
eukprot:1152569-Pelagomonas_calceolata.AAC.1